MAWEQLGFCDSHRLAGVDLTDNQFKMVKLAANGTVTRITAATDKPYGVQQNDPKIGQPVVVCRDGITKLACLANVVSDNQIGTNAAGLGAVIVPGTDTTKYLIGSVVDGNGASGSYASVSVDFLSPGRAA